MPEYEKYPDSPNRGLIDELYRRNDALERRIKYLENQQTSRIQRVDIEEHPGPIEGQNVVDANDEQHAWFSNGEWRKAGAPPKWHSLYPHDFVYGQPITNTTQTTLHFPSRDGSADAVTPTGHIFATSAGSDPDFLFPQVQYVSLMLSGIYTFHLQVAWLDIEGPETLVDYFLYSSPSSAMRWPGKAPSQPVINALYCQTYRNKINYSTWDFQETVSWHVPLIVNPPALIVPSVTAVFRDPSGALISGDIGTVDAMLDIIYHGPLGAQYSGNLGGDFGDQEV